MSYLNLNKNKKGGLIKTAFIVIVAVVAVSFFVDIKSTVDSKLDTKRLKSNIQYMKTFSVSVWKGYISASAHNAWDKVFNRK